MLIQAALFEERLFAERTLVRLYPRMQLHVIRQVVPARERPFAESARKRPLARVRTHMFHKVILTVERLRTLQALERVLARVRTGVAVQVALAVEHALADGTLERRLVGVVQAYVRYVRRDQLERAVAYRTVVLDRLVRGGLEGFGGVVVHRLPRVVRVRVLHFDGEANVVVGNIVLVVGVIESVVVMFLVIVVSVVTVCGRCWSYLDVLRHVWYLHT